MEEQIEVLRTLWQGGMVEHHGEFYDFDRLEMAPVPRRPVPILVGGHSDIALRRAARIGDGWMGVYYDTEALKEIVRRLQGFRQEYGTADRPFEIQASIVDRMPTPDVCAELADEGVTCIITSAWMMQGLQFAPLDENVRPRGLRRAVHRPAARRCGPTPGRLVDGSPDGASGLSTLTPMSEQVEQASDLRAADGRARAPRAGPRQKLLDCTAEMLRSTSYRAVKVIDIAREAGTSPATFYQYFADVEAAILVLAQEMALDGERLVRLVAEGNWKGRAGYQTSLDLTDAFFAFWDQHRPVLRGRPQHRRGRPPVPQHPGRPAHAVTTESSPR